MRGGRYPAAVMVRPLATIATATKFEGDRTLAAHSGAEKRTTEQEVAQPSRR